MSYSSPPPPNPDSRTLPPGWIEQYDRNYNTWFYVNTSISPPQSSWVHPLGPPGSPRPPSGYAAPLGPPPPNSPYNNQAYAQPQPVGGYDQRPPQQYGGGYGGGGYGGPSQSPWQGGGGYQSESRGFFSRPQQQQPQVVYQQAPPPQKSGPGIGTMLAVGGAGLLGGALIENAIDDHEEHEEREAYDNGYQDGQDNDYGDQGYDDGGDF